MPKINQEEYEVLKSLDDRWKWIARNYNGALITYTDKPTKNSNLYWDSFGERMDDRLFQFIQWEDEEPYNIAELIREYEKHEFVKINHEGQERLNKLFGNESEEKEMKDIEWLKEEIEEDIKSWGGGNPDYFRGASDAYENVKDWLNQLDEPEVLSQEWIDEHSYNIEEYWEAADMMDGAQYAVSVENLPNLLVQKQEKVEEGRVRLTVGFDGGTESYYATDIGDALDFLTDYDARFTVSKEPIIPQFVADFIEVRKDTDAYTLKYILCVAVERSEQEEYTKAYDWISANDELFARAWLDGYTVEKEQKYYVYLGDGQYLVSEDELKEPYVKIRHEEDSGFANNVLTFTEQEIKDYDERFWPFAVKVEEVEE